MISCFQTLLSTVNLRRYTEVEQRQVVALQDARLETARAETKGSGASPAQRMAAAVKESAIEANMVGRCSLTPG